MTKCKDNIGRQRWFSFLSEDYLLEDEQGLSMGGECWRWISVNLEYLLYIGFDYDLQLTRH
jgi:hypothetical protein